MIGEQHGNHLRTTPGETGTGVQGVTAVVAGAGQQDDPGAVRAAEEVADGNSKAVRRPLHQRAFGQLGHQLGLSRPDLLDSMRATHPQPSSTTTAEAIPASWLKIG